jgi:G3E family GTPase
VDIFAASFQAETPLDRNAFSKTLRKYGESILRLKGNVDFGQGPVFVELAGGELLEKEAVNLSGSAGSTAFTVIAWKVSKDELAGEFGLPSNLTKDSQTP